MEAGKMRQGIGMLDPDQQAVADAEFFKAEQKEYLLMYVSVNDERTFFIRNGRNNFIPELKGYIESGEMDVDNSYVLTEDTELKDRLSVREFAKHVNKSLPEELRIYIDDDSDEYDEELSEGEGE
jgi:hypothetical protein